jgi:hypothetical protein
MRKDIPYLEEVNFFRIMIVIFAVRDACSTGSILNITPGQGFDIIHRVLVR